MQQHDIARAVGAKARAARAEAGLSRKRLADLADVSERYLADLEKGEANASIGILARIAEALSVDFSSLLPAAREGAGGAAPPSQHALPSLHGPLATLVASMSPAEQQDAVGLLGRYLEERRRALRGVALLGLRGAGKSTLGRRFAERHRLPFVSITREIEARAGMTLADLFNLGGPDAYRALENEVVHELVRREERIVLETAGGIVGNPEALEVILASFKTVWLKASPEEHLARVARQGDTRPMRGNPKAIEHLTALLAQREPEYARAECVLDTSGRASDDCLAELERIAAPMLAARSGSYCAVNPPSTTSPAPVMNEESSEAR
jgi:XRE family aerobic/anaerobic benzoate catabolism transcriptional regulator